MRVESARVFSIVAHELRGPLGVIQGYVRMLRTRRAGDELENRMLTAILDATGRLSTMARQASDLAVWQKATPPGERARLSVRSLVERAAAHDSLPRPVIVEVASEVADEALDAQHPGALADAIGSLVVAASRESAEATIRLRAMRGAHGAPLIAIGPEAVVGQLSADAADAADTNRADERLFTGGGQGLGLVLAASVLDYHHIAVGLIESMSDVIVLRLPKEGRL